MSAAQAGDLEAVQLLCMFGANPHIVDRVCIRVCITHLWYYSALRMRAKRSNVFGRVRLSVSQSVSQQVLAKNALIRQADGC